MSESDHVCQRIRAIVGERKYDRPARGYFEGFFLLTNVSLLWDLSCGIKFKTYRDWGFFHSTFDFSFQFMYHN